MDNIWPDIRPDIRPDIQRDIRLDIRPDIRLDIRPDIRPDIRLDIRPDIRPDRVKNRSPIPAKSAKIIVKQMVFEPPGTLHRIQRIHRKRNIGCGTDPGFPTPGVRMTVVYTNSLKLKMKIKIRIVFFKVGEVVEGGKR